VVTVKVNLLKFERIDMMIENSISKIIFFEGSSDEVYSIAKERMLKLLELNPWLASRLVKDKKSKEVIMEFDENESPESQIKSILFEEKNLCIDSSMDFEQMLLALKPHIVAPGRKLLKTCGMVTRVTILKHEINQCSGFAILFSISHVAADGYTYYKILNSFFDPSQMSVMNYQRKIKESEKIKEFIGDINYNFAGSLALIVNILKNLIFGRKVKYLSRYIDENKIDTIKSEYLAGDTKEFPFLSTNDIITSSFARATKSRLCLSAINLRNRIEGMNNDDAGNYEFVLMLDEKHYNTPENIRRTLSSKGKFLVNDGVLPGIWESLNSNYSTITNAASFIEDYQISGLKQILHIPLFNPKKAFMDFGVVYKANNGRRAILFFGKKTSLKDYIAEAELGESVCSSLFRN